MIDLWNQIAERAGLSLSPQQHEQLGRFLDLLLQANQTMNLTRIIDRADAELRYVGDSLTLLPFLPPAAHRLADIGSGGGAPGIVLAIARPDAAVTLIESTKKKAVFLERAVSELGLSTVRVLPLRVEEVANGPDRESFDIATVRAVATMPWLVEWGLPLLKKKGKLLAMKGPKLAEELPAAVRAIRRLGGGPPVVHPAAIAGAEGHVIVEIVKITPTAERYPRLPTRAKGQPLG